jgi:hypothetical protein
VNGQGDGPPVSLSFPYYRSLAPTLGVLLGLAIAETLVLHVVAMAMWGWRVALVLALLDLSVVVMLIRLLRSMRRLPVMIEGRRVTLRLGTLRRIEIDVADIAGLREGFDAAAIKRRDVANLALAGWPNILIDLHRPIASRRGRTVSAIAHRLDDPGAFHAALARLEAAHADRREQPGA